jgi:NAD(P)-dependent dehydrogenase (short-subunit alcohol dehydrogenase family)
MSQVWLVTGSSRGLGRAIVEASLAAGNKVMATARNTESLNDLSDRYGNQVKLFAFDVIDESAATAAVKTAIDTFGSLDVVVNNVTGVQNSESCRGQLNTGARNRRRESGEESLGVLRHFLSDIFKGLYRTHRITTGILARFSVGIPLCWTATNFYTMRKPMNLG